MKNTLLVLALLVSSVAFAQDSDVVADLPDNNQVNGNIYVNCQDYGDVIVDLDIMNELINDMSRIIRQVVAENAKQAKTIRVLRRRLAAAKAATN